MSYEDRQAERAERRRKRSCRYQASRGYRYLCNGTFRLPNIEDARTAQRWLLWAWSKFGIPRPILICCLGGVGCAGAVYETVGLAVARVYLKLRQCYAVARHCWHHEAVFDYDDLIAAVLEGRVDDLRFIYLDKFAALDTEETTLDGKSMLFLAMERALGIEFQLREEMEKLAREERVSANLFFAPAKQQRVELEDVEIEERKKQKASMKADADRERAAIRASRREKVKVRSTVLPPQKKKKKTKAERLKEAGMKPPTPLDLMKAAERQSKVCLFFTGRGANVNTQQDPRRHEGTGWSILHHAAVHGNVPRITWILNKGALVDLATEEGETPLMMAAKAGATRGVQYLLEYNASVNKTCFKGWTPLHYAGSVGALDCAALILRAGASKNARTVGTVLTPSDLAKNAGHSDTFSLIKLYKEPETPVREVFEAMRDADADKPPKSGVRALASSLGL